MTRFVFFDFDDVLERNGKDRLHSTNIIELQIEFSNCYFFFFERNDNRQTKKVSKHIKKKQKKRGRIWPKISPNTLYITTHPFDV